MSDEISFYNREGKPIALDDWALLYGDKEYRMVGEDQTPLGVVKTMWFGFVCEGTSAPMYGTALIDNEGHFWEVSHYPDEAEAIAGHRRLVADLRSDSPFKPGGAGERHGEADDDR